MATEYKVFKLTALPAVLEANSIYYTEGPNAGELNITVTNIAGDVTRSVISHAEVDARILSAIAANNSIKSVADITARDALGLTANGMVLVLDATDDANVDNGSALYFYTFSTDAFEKVAEYESLELEWQFIKNKPASTVANIDEVTTALIGNADSVLKDISKDATSGDLSYNTKLMGHTYFGDTPEW